MKKHILFGTLALLAGSLMVAQAAPKDDVKAAAKKLGDNYTWKVTVENAGGGGGGGGGRGFGGGPSEGKTAGGQTWISRTARDTTIEVFTTGTNKGAIKGPEGWQSLAEASAAGGGGGGGGGGGVMGTVRMVQNFKAPAVQAAELADQAGELKQDADAIAGDLTEAGAKSLLSWRPGGGGGEGPQVSNAKGSVKFWVKDGQVVKYLYKVSGSVNFNGNDREVDRTTTVEIKDVGTTKVEVPEEAKKKLS
ncbi:MAG: hypothetical protein H7Y43_02475 [Akkermansiaceae bacterium]|nr:hypothetical protein [Verrucomicrobiales bacterium]